MSRRNRWGVGVVGLLFLAGCKRCGNGGGTVAPATALEGDAGEVTIDASVPSGDVRGATFSFTLAVYHFATAPPAAQAEVRKLLTAAGAAIAAMPLPTHPQKTTVAIETPPLKAFAPPSLESLRYRGRTLSEQEKQALQTTVGVTVLSFAGPAAGAASAYQLALRAGLVLESAAPGILFDDDTREAISRAAWTARLDDWSGDVVPVARHIVIDAYQDGELLRLVTLGMAKFALPDLSVNQVPKHEADGMSALVNLACQTLLEHPQLTRPGELDVRVEAIANPIARQRLQQQMLGGSGSGVLHLAIATRHEGDAENRLIEVAFPGPATKLQERQARTVADILGTKDEIVGVKHDAALMEASKRARARALLLKPRFAKGAPDMEQLLVKGPFKTASGDNEWMWIEVTRWSGATIEGILQNEPAGEMPIKVGARVSVPEESIFDYIHRHADGGVDGDETSALLEKSGVRRR
ncbi:hypothetical protein BH11MYX4_BH11MYX4_67530 [soil metagenome]